MTPNLLTTKTRAAKSLPPNRFLRRLVGKSAAAILSLLGASVLVWALLPLAGGDVATRVLEARGVENPSEIEIEAARIKL